MQRINTQNFAMLLLQAAQGLEAPATSRVLACVGYRLTQAFLLLTALCSACSSDSCGMFTHCPWPLKRHPARSTAVRLLPTTAAACSSQTCLLGGPFRCFSDSIRRCTQKKICNSLCYAPTMIRALKGAV